MNGQDKHRCAHGALICGCHPPFMLTSCQVPHIYRLSVTWAVPVLGHIQASTRGHGQGWTKHRGAVALSTTHTLLVTSRKVVLKRSCVCRAAEPFCRGNDVQDASLPGLCTDCRRVYGAHMDLRKLYDMYNARRPSMHIQIEPQNGHVRDDLMAATTTIPRLPLFFAPFKTLMHSNILWIAIMPKKKVKQASVSVMTHGMA